MLTNKIAKLSFIVASFFAVLFMSGGQAIAWSVKATWDDRAHINVTEVKIGDSDRGELQFSLGEEANATVKIIGDDGLKTLVDNQARGVYFDDDIRDGELNYTEQHCRGNNNIDVDGGRLEDNKGALALNFLVFDMKQDSRLAASPHTTDDEGCHFLTGLPLGSERNTKKAVIVDIGEGWRKDIWFKVINKATLERVDGRDGQFKNVEGQNENMYYALGIGGRCDDGQVQRVILEDASKKAAGDIIEGKYETCESGGQFSGMFDIKVKDGKNITKDGSPAGKDAADPDNPANQNEQNPTCESTGWLTWIICPVINGLAEVADGAFEHFIEPMLMTPPVDIVNTGSPVFKVWVAMRNIANILLVIAMIVIVFGQAIGGGLVDAYTAKKVLPRILAAAILINLSIYIVAFAVDVTNVIGQGISQLMYAPFQSAGSFKFNLSQGTAGIGIVGLVGAGGAIWAATAAGVITSFIPWLLLMVLLPLAIAMLGVLFTLVVRQGLIQFLIISSPIAFALYCLPNTEQYFKKWWGLFTKALLVYPIVMIVFAMADILAVTTDLAAANDPGASQLPAQIISIVLLVLPLFMIPYAFKMAGGAIGAIHGALTDRGNKVAEGIKGNPNDQDSMRNRYRRNAAIARTAAGITPGMAGARLNPKNILNKDRRKADISAQRNRGIEVLRKQIEGTPQWQAAQGDSNVTKLLANHTSEKSAKAWIDRTYAGAANADKRTKMYGALATASQIGFNKSSQRAALMNPYYIKFETPQGQEGWDQALNSFATLAGGQMQFTDLLGDRLESPHMVGGDQFLFRSLMDEYQAVAKGAAGRADQAANVDGNTAYDLTKATGSQSLYTLLNGHPNGVEGLINEHMKVMNNPLAKSKDKELSATFLREMSTASTKNQGTAGVRDKINKHKAAMQAAVDKYINRQVADMANKDPASLPTTRQQRQEVTVTDPATGVQTTTTQFSNIDISGDMAARQQEAARQLSAHLDDLGRGYTPMDPNNMEDGH